MHWSGTETEGALYARIWNRDRRGIACTDLEQRQKEHCMHDTGTETEGALHARIWNRDRRGIICMDMEQREKEYNLYLSYSILL